MDILDTYEGDLYTRPEAIEKFGYARVQREVDKKKDTTYLGKTPRGKGWWETRLRDFQKGDFLKNEDSEGGKVFKVLSRPYITEIGENNQLAYMVFVEPYKGGDLSVRG